MSRNAASFRLLLLIATLSTLSAAAAHATARTWSSTTGSAGDATQWSPSAVPSLNDSLLFSSPSPYTVTFPGTVPQVRAHRYFDGTIGVACSSPHTISNLLTIGGNLIYSPVVTLQSGNLKTRQLMIPGETNSGRAGLIVNGVTSLFETTDSTAENIVGGSVGGFMYVTGGAQALVRGRIKAAACTLYVAGQGGAPIVGSLLNIASPLPLFAGGIPTGLILDAQAGAGHTVLDIVGRGRAIIRGAMVVGQFQQGEVHVGPGGSFTSILTALDPVFIGGGAEVGSGVNSYGEFMVDDRGLFTGFRSFKFNFGRVTVQQNATVTVYDSVIIKDPDLTLNGGLFANYGGTFTYAPNPNLGNFALEVSSNVGTPELRIANGNPNPPIVSGLPAAVPAIRLGGSGQGTLRLLRSGTSFGTGAGRTILGESAGGNGSLVVDSMAHFAGDGGQVIVGKVATGSLTVLNGATASAATLILAQKPASSGTALIKHAGSQLVIADTLDIGGYANVPGGTASLTVDSSAIVQVAIDRTAVAVSNIFSNGVVSVNHGALLDADGPLACQGVLALDDGTIESAQLSLFGGGTLGGHGLVRGDVLNFAHLAALGSGLEFEDTLYSYQGSGETIGGSIIRILPGGAFRGAIYFNCALENQGDVGVRSDLPLSTVPVEQTYTQAAGAKLRIRLGNGANRECDLLYGAHSVVLDGTLELSHGPNFHIAPGDSFTVMNYLSRTGTFSNVTFEGGSAAGLFQVVYLPNTVVVVVQPGIVGVEPGDPHAPAALRFTNAGTLGHAAFSLELPAEADVRVAMYDVAGRQVARLCDGPMPAGVHRLDAASHALPGGVYFARAWVRGASGERVLTARAVSLR